MKDLDFDIAACTDLAQIDRAFEAVINQAARRGVHLPETTCFYCKEKVIGHRCENCGAPS